jgi:hypothetical protein
LHPRRAEDTDTVAGTFGWLGSAEVINHFPQLHDRILYHRKVLFGEAGRNGIVLWRIAGDHHVLIKPQFSRSVGIYVELVIEITFTPRITSYSAILARLLIQSKGLQFYLFFCHETLAEFHQIPLKSNNFLMTGIKSLRYDGGIIRLVIIRKLYLTSGSRFSRWREYVSGCSG